jgi:AMP-polyphosphate phosphotransferase
VSKCQFKSRVPQLRQELLRLQERLYRGRAFSVILLFSGVDGAGKHEMVHLLNQWMDARRLSTCAYDEPTTEERERPSFWRFWRDLPPCGTTGMFLSAWYSNPVLDRVYGRIDENGFEKCLRRINSFEQALARDGALILKFWMHLSRQAQEARLKGRDCDPLTEATVKQKHWAHFEHYDRFIDTAEIVISRTHRDNTPWSIVEGLDDNYRSLNVAEAFRDALRTRLEESERGRRTLLHNGADQGNRETAAVAGGEKSAKNGGSKSRITEPPKTVLSQLQMRSIAKEDYEQRLQQLQARLHRLQFKAKARGVPSVLLLEGPDAAGKGGAIRRVTAALDPRDYQVYGISAPSEDERRHHYLWRFWHRLPRAGKVAIFDRSWFGRVLVERVEGIATEREWRRAYSEINEFESQFAEAGGVLVKYWIHITKSEQLKRFKERKTTPFKQWKLTDEDWRNRKKWDQYSIAVNDMIQYTSTRIAPWTLVEGNDKRFARVKVLETYCERLEAAVADRVA